jgi:hypothetical protein
MSFSSCRSTAESYRRLGYADDPDKDVTWQVSHLTRETYRIIWHQRLEHTHSRRVSDMHKYAIGVPNFWDELGASLGATSLSTVGDGIGEELVDAALGVDDGTTARCSVSSLGPHRGTACAQH